MLKRIIVLFLVGCSVGCSTLPKTGGSHKVAEAVPPAVTFARVETAVEAAPPKEQTEPAPKSVPSGVVFGKTNFRGLLKTAYVRLTIVADAEPERKLFFYIGSKENQSVLLWDAGKLLEPGYFYFELPQGKYKVTSLAIPVASTLAEEDVSLAFEVAVDHVFYLGTLDVDGTKERVKFGGVPVVKPGFEYGLSVHDDFENAKKDFEGMLPQHKAEIKRNLMVVTPAENPVEGQ